MQNTSLILDDPSCQSVPDDFREHESILNGRIALNSCKIFMYDIENAICSLSDGIGFDSIHSNLFRYSSSGLKKFLCRFFNCIISHNYIPDKILSGQIRPTIKNKLGSKNDSNNYRPVMNSSNICLLYTSPSPRDKRQSRMPSSA